MPPRADASRVRLWQVELRHQNAEPTSDPGPEPRRNRGAICCRVNLSIGDLRRDSGCVTSQNVGQQRRNHRRRAALTTDTVGSARRQTARSDSPWRWFCLRRTRLGRANLTGSTMTGATLETVSPRRELGGTAERRRTADLSHDFRSSMVKTSEKRPSSVNDFRSSMAFPENSTVRISAACEGRSGGCRRCGSSRARPGYRCGRWRGS
jgi:hypothetical protein